MVLAAALQRLGILNMRWSSVAYKIILYTLDSCEKSFYELIWEWSLKAFLLGKSHAGLMRLIKSTDWVPYSNDVIYTLTTFITSFVVHVHEHEFLVEAVGEGLSWAAQLHRGIIPHSNYLVMRSVLPTRRSLAHTLIVPAWNEWTSWGFWSRPVQTRN